MNTRVLFLAGALATAALVAPALAYAVLITVTNPTDPGALASCPGSASVPCTVISRTTAEQVEVGSRHAPMMVTSAGRLVGWRVTLSSPSTAQIRYFDAHEGGTSRAAIAVIRQVHGLDYRLEYESRLVHLEPYFGRTATFALSASVPLSAGDVIALAVPTWVPALELQAGPRTAWRASRSANECDDVATETAQTTLGAVAEYYCIYRTALLDFGAIEISTP
jgi:hypothetical protein